MPDPSTRCAECGATFAAHDDPEIVVDRHAFAGPHVRPSFAAPVSAPAADSRRTIEKLEAQMNEQGADLAILTVSHAEAEAVNELWGAFDYELDILAERFGIELDPDRAPLDAVRALMAMARNAPEIPIYSEEVAP